MGQPYIGEIRMFAGNFAPVGWEFCNGQLLQISENDALFNLIGTTYGGDGQSTFGLPDLRGRAPIHAGQGPGLSNHVLGETAGVETVTLNTNQIPSHTHTLFASGNKGTSSDPTGNYFAADAASVPNFVNNPNNMVNMAAGAMASSGGSQPHENRQPYLAISFIISLFGIFPTPS